MPDQEALQPIDSSTDNAPAPRKPKWRWQWLVAPLMGVSVILHIALLFVPVPSWDLIAEEVMEEEPPPEEEEEAIDILSLSDIAPPAPPPEEPPVEQPPPQESPPTGPPPVPDPEELPEELPPEEELPIEEEFPDETEQIFDPVIQEEQLKRAAGINVEFDKTSEFPSIIWDLGYIQDLGPARINCFFDSISQDSYALGEGANRLKFFTRNYGLVVNEDLPITYPNQLAEDPNGYCGEALFEVQENGEAATFVSAIKVGPGDPPGSVLLVFWTSDPRYF